MNIGTDSIQFFLIIPIVIIFLLCFFFLYQQFFLFCFQCLQGRELSVTGFFLQEFYGSFIDGKL